MNRKNAIGRAQRILTSFFALLLGSLAFFLAYENETLQETLSEKENVISDMETQIADINHLYDDMKHEMENTRLQHAEVLQTLKQVEEQYTTLQQENEALRGQNETLTSKVSTLEKKNKELSLPSRGNSSVAKEFYVEATAYTAYCKGCSGKTTTGINLRANPDVKVIAVDPKIIPLGTKVWVEGYGYAIAADTGGDIKGNRIDVFIPTKAEAYQWGRKKGVRIKVLGT